MGKFGIGARVRDDGGDEGVIVDKAKGGRLIKYDDVDYGKLWQPKGCLTALPANDNAGTPSISTEISESAYVAVGDNSDKPWVPKVGDRVRFVRDSTAGGWCFGKAGEEAEVTEPVRGSGETLAVSVRLSTTKCDFDPGAYIRDLEPVVAPATTWTPKVGERVAVKNAKNSFRIGTPAGCIATVTAVDGDNWISVDLEHPIDGTIDQVCRTADIEPAPLTIEAGKFYRTRDGRKVGPAQVGGPFNVGTDDQGRKAFAYILGQDYTVDGIWLSGNGNECPDLVAEWVEPVPEVAVAEATATVPESKFGFTVGDRIRPKAEDATWVNGHYDKAWSADYGKSDGTYFVRGFTGSEVGISAKNEGDVACYFFPTRFEPAAPPAKFKVGDRVNWTKRRTSWQGCTITEISQWPVDAFHPFYGTGCFNLDELELATDPSIPVGATVTFTATGRLSAYTTDGHAQIVFPGLTPGQNSFALPAAFVALAH